MDRRADTLMALAVALFGLFIFFAAAGIRPASVYDPIGSRGAPQFIGLAIAVGGVALMLRRLLAWRREETLVPPEGVVDDGGVAEGTVIRAMAFWLAAMVYVLLLPRLGYPLATPLFVLAGLLVFGVRRPAMLVLIPIGFTLPVFLMFSQVLNVRLPSGVLDAPLRQLGLL